MVHNAYAQHDFTKSSADAVTWSMVEANTGIICASLIALKPLIVYLFPKNTEVRQPPRYSMTLKPISTPSDSEAEKGAALHRELVERTASVDKHNYAAYEDMDALTLVGTRRSYADGTLKKQRTRSWGDDILLETEDIVERPEAVALSPACAQLLEEDETRQQRSALDLRRGSQPGKGYER